MAPPSEFAVAPGSPISTRRADDAKDDPTANPPTHAAADDWIFASGGASSGRGVDPSDQVDADAGIAAAPVAAFGALPILGQLRASYLLAETDDGLIVVDQHAAHERILYEGLRKQWLDSGVARQGLLTPVPVSLAPGAHAALETATELAERLGFEIESFGEGAVLVRSVPVELAGQDVVSLVTDLAAALEEAPRDGESDASAIRWLPSLDRLFATLACHSARRFGDRLPEAEQRAILTGLDTIPWAPTCPHGRPVAILIRHEDLELRFRRR
jgi:DNA mismatch repair protein MutL